MEHASFTPLIFTINGAMGEECKTFVAKLSELLAVKKDLPKSTVTSWVRAKISFALVRSMWYVQVVHVPSKTVQWQ